MAESITVSTTSAAHRWITRARWAKFFGLHNLGSYCFLQANKADPQLRNSLIVRVTKDNCDA